MKPYIWIKSKLIMSSSPFIDIKNIKLTEENIIGRDTYFKDLPLKQYIEIINRLLSTYFRSKIIRVKELPIWMVGSIDGNVVKIKIDLQTLVEEALKKETYDDYGGDLMVRQCTQLESRSSYYDKAFDKTLTPSTLIDYLVTSASRIPIARKPFIMSPTDVNWLSRFMNIWTQQATTYKINEERMFKKFTTNVVGGPKVDTMCGKADSGLFHYSPPKIDITLASNRVYRKPFKNIIKDFTSKLVHEYTHFLQKMYVMSLPDSSTSSFWNIPGINNPTKYYRSMWERDAYAIELLYEYLASKNLSIEALGDGKVLKEQFNAEAYKNFVRKSGEYRWAVRNMKDKDADGIWLNGLVYGASKFVQDMQINVPQNETQEEDIDIKKIYKADVFSSVDIIEAYITKASIELNGGDDYLVYSEGNRDNLSDDFIKQTKQQEKEIKEIEDTPIENLFIGDSNNSNKYQAGVQVSLEQPRWSDEEIQAECIKLGVKVSPELVYCSNIEGMTYHCGLSDAIKSANLYVE